MQTETETETKSETETMCEWCKNDPVAKDDTICIPCRKESFTCQQCNERAHNDNSNQCISCDDMYCDDCWSDISNTCNECDNSYCNNCGQWCNRHDASFCSDDCANNHYENEEHINDNDDDNMPYLKYRAYKNLSPQAEPKEGKILQSTRLLGVEIEAYLPSDKKARTRAIDIINAKIPPSVGMVEDNSLGTHGIEFQTPPLAGAEVESQIKLLETITKNAGLEINRSCGLHIHVDCTDIAKNYQKQKLLWRLYYMFDDVFLAMLPKSRRDNRFCKALKKQYAIAKLDNITSQDALEALWYSLEHETGDKLKEKLAGKKSSKYDDTRYSGINFHSLFKDKHIEIRYHSGTLNAEKILQWANIHTRLIDRVARGLDDVGEVAMHDAINSVLLEEKLHALYDILKLNDKAKRYINMRIKTFAPNTAPNDETLSATKPQ